MRLPGVDQLARVRVPTVVRTTTAPLVERLTSYAVTAGRLLDAAIDDAIGAVVRRVMAGLDEEQIMALAEKIDVDQIARRLDIESVLDRMDLTDTVLKRVDLIKVVDAVLTQMDLIALANQIIEGVDLPEIIRDSTGSMASETVQGVRMQGIGADQAVGRAVDRILLRHARAGRTPGA